MTERGETLVSTEEKCMEGTRRSLQRTRRHNRRGGELMQLSMRDGSSVVTRKGVGGRHTAKCAE